MSAVTSKNIKNTIPQHILDSLNFPDIPDDEFGRKLSQFSHNGSVSTFVNCLRWLRLHSFYGIGVELAGLVYDIFSYDADFLDEYGMLLFHNEQYEMSASIYADILSFTTLDKNMADLYLRNANLSAPFMLQSYTNYNIQKVKSISLNTQCVPLITFSITTCKRLHLFEKTMNSFLACCEDIERITSWLCVDDNSSDADRKRMKELYPFFTFIWKTPEQKGHAKSMNLILEHVSTPYLFHMEDDWQFFRPCSFLEKCMQVLDSHPKYGQCLLNRNYGELVEDDTRILGGEFKTTKYGIRYYIHEHITDTTEFVNKYGNGSNCAYWAHYSLRAGLNRVSALKHVGVYNPDASHFEMDYAYRYMEKGYKTTFLESILCQHIGRLTSERTDTSKPNAYTLNDEQQFVKEEKKISTNTDPDAGSQVEGKMPNEPTVDSKHTTSDESTAKPTKIPVEIQVINMDSRTDRWQIFEQNYKQSKRFKNRNFPYKRMSAVNGYNLKPNRYLEQLFNPNDFNYRCGMIGCALSHLKLWVELANKDSFQMMIVLEDDVEFVPYFLLKLENVFAKLDANETEWDVIFLGHHIYPQYVTDSTYDKQRLPVASKWSVSDALSKSAGGTGGYIIHTSSARKLVRYIQQVGMIHGIDTMMQKACDIMEIYYCEPHLIYSDQYTCETMHTVDTDIQNNYDSLRRPISQRLNDEYTYFDSLGISYGICDSHIYSSHSDKKEVVFCYNACQQAKDNGDIQYKIGDDIYVCIPSDLFASHVKSFGLIFNKTLSTDHIIQYK